jgi:DNA-binding winged helix-turn-helix (wHTH) protein/TolB-like protein/tetratricopeptide (TPR) repeat protein
MMKKPAALYEFVDFVLDVGQQRLHRKGTAESVALTGKTFDTLVFLVEHAGEPLGRDAILQAVWPGVVVEENSLTQIISGLRQILGEARGENRYIATLPRKGYRFVAPVRVCATPPPSPACEPDPVPQPPAVSESVQVLPDPMPDSVSVPHRHRTARWTHRPFAWIASTMAIVAIVAAAVVVWFRPAPESSSPVQSLAILPFKPLLTSERDEALELGMTESLISHMAQNSQQKIQPLSSVRRFTAIDQDAVTAGRALGVDAVLDGLMQRDHDRLRVSVRLLQVKDGRQLWARTFEQPFTRIFEVEDSIVSQIAYSLVWQPKPINTHPPWRETTDSEAFALFASGRFAELRLTEPSVVQAIGFFEEAIARDPNYARPYAGIADCNVLLVAVLGARSADEMYPKARSAAAKALTLNPNLAAAHVSLGQIKMVYDRDLQGAEHELARARELDLDYAPTYFYLGTLYAFKGDVDRALATFDRAVQLDPYMLAIRAARALTLYHARRYDESIASLRQILALDERFDLARGFLMRALLAKGEYAQVLTEMQGRTMRGPGSHAFVGQALALSGHRGEARAELARVLTLSKTQHVAAYDVAMIYAALDDPDNTFLWLDRAVLDGSPIGTMPLEPTFDKLHGDPRFEQLVARIRTPREAS